MNLSVYKLSDVQRFKSLLVGMRGNGAVTLDEAIASMEEVIKNGHQTIAESAEQKTVRAEIELCPSCNKGIVSFWPKISAQVGSRVYGCKKCQWSEVR